LQAESRLVNRKEWKDIADAYKMKKEIELHWALDRLDDEVMPGEELDENNEGERTNRIFKDNGLYTIVTLSTSPHPTPLERRYEGYLNYPGSTFCSNITLAVAKYASRCALVQVKICSSGLACKTALSASWT
jgi:hypothetical protein